MAVITASQVSPYATTFGDTLNVAAIVPSNGNAVYTNLFGTTVNIAPIVPQAGNVSFPFADSNPSTPSAIGMPFLFTAANWTNGEFKLIAYLRSTIGQVYVDLYDLTAAMTVTGSVLTVSSTALNTYESSALTLEDGHVYILRTYKDTGAQGVIVGASIRVRMP